MVDKLKISIIGAAIFVLFLGSETLIEQSFEHSPNPNLLYLSDGGRHLAIVDEGTGVGTIIAPMSPVPAGRGFIGMTFDSQSPELLWAGQGSGNSNIVNVDIVVGTTTLVGNAGLGSTAVNGMDVGPGPRCEIYAILDQVESDGTGNDHLVTINRSTGAALDVGSLGMDGMDAIAFKSDGSLYGVGNTFQKKGATTTLFTINTSTGETNSVGMVKDTDTNKSPSGGILAIEFVGENDELFAGTGKAAGGRIKDGGFVGTIDGLDFTPLGMPATTGSPVEDFAPLVADNFPPTITLNGLDLVILQRGNDFVDPGATSDDCHDGQDTNVLGDTSGLNINVVGEQSVLYTATDTTGLTTSVSRTVNVIDFIFFEPYEINTPESFAVDENNEPLGNVALSAFEIQDAAQSGSITARIYTDSDNTGITVTLNQVGNTNSFFIDDVILTTDLAAAAGESGPKLLAVSGDKIFIEYEGITSDPPATAGSTDTGFGSPPSSTDAIRFDSDAFPPEASTDIIVTLVPLPGSPPATVTVNLRDDDGAGTDVSLSIPRVGTTNTYQTTLPVILSTHLANSAGSPTENPVLSVEIGDTIFASSPSVASFTAEAVIITPPPAVAIEDPTTAVSYTTNINCRSALGLVDSDRDGICNGSSSLVPWETGNKPLRIYLTTAERGNSALHYIYADPASTVGVISGIGGCPRLLDIRSNPVVDNVNNPFTCPHPSKKDIFVEVDHQVNHDPDPDALLDVVKAFKNRNINLHISVDQEYFVINDNGTPDDTSDDFEVPLHESSTSWTRFQELKTSFFGTADEQALSDAVAKLTKKRQVFHYNGWIHALPPPSDLSSGRAEIGGNDFVTSMGPFDRSVGSQDQQAASFMHELVHNLNVRHGGADDINCKPSYASVMNYAHEFPLESGGIIPKAQWKLDISGRAQNFINENALDETVAVMTGPDPRRPSPIWTVVGGPGLTPQVVQMGTTVNWDQAAGPTTYAQNVRDTGIVGCRIGDPDQSPATINFRGYSDLSLMRYDIRVFGSFADGLSTVAHVDGDLFAPVSPGVLATLTANPVVLLPVSTFSINEGDGTTQIPLARIIDYDSLDVDVVIDWNDFETVPTESLDNITVGGTVPDIDLTGDHAYGDNGNTSIELTVTNDRDGEVVASVPITVNNVAPTIGTVTVSPSSTVFIGNAVTVSAEFTDPGRLDTHEPSTIAWGDGDVSTTSNGLSLTEPSSPGEVSASHTYAATGTFTVTITVEDDDGGQDQTTVEITVEGLRLGQFISPIDVTTYNDKRTLPIKIPVTDSSGTIAPNAEVFVFLDDAPAISKQSPDNRMVFNPQGGFYDYGLAFPRDTPTGPGNPHIITVVLTGGEFPDDTRSVTIIVS